MTITGTTLIEMGYEQGPHFGIVLPILNQERHTEDEIAALMQKHAPLPKVPLQSPAPCAYNITAETPYEIDNLRKLQETMNVILETPVVLSAAIMPDACPAGPVGTIPVGGVVVTNNAICPGMHSADVCCSLMMTTIADATPLAVLDAIQETTHFGPCYRGQEARYELPDELQERMIDNPFFDKTAITIAARDLGTQGDGNHFAYTGVLESTGETTLVTHHGSRGVGARLYKAGMKLAETYRLKLSPDTHKANAWIPLDSDDGVAYWEALQIVRDWTRLNHQLIHNTAIEIAGGSINYRRWNEHNFVFKDGSHVYHAKGATPVNNDFMPDTDGYQIIPFNMREPILIVEGEMTENNLGFAPHGAGRNMSRTQFAKTLEGRKSADVLAEDTAGIDARWFSGKYDLSELPSAYKSAESVQSDMKRFNLAGVVDRVLPYGSIMAGHMNKPWRK